MHVKVPPELQEVFEKEFRAQRLHSGIKLFPAVVAIFSAVAWLVVFVKAHAVIRLIAMCVQSELSTTQLMYGVTVLIIVFSTAATIYVLRRIYKEKFFSQHLFCQKCNALDYDEVGKCPCCDAKLHTRATFFFTVYDDEVKIVDRYGFTESRKS